MLARWFETRVRVGDESFVTLTETRPEWLFELVMACHDGEMPNDWRYQVCADIASAFDEPDGIHPDELADSLVDVGMFDLISWMGDNLARVGDVDSANDDYGWSHDDGVVGLIRLGQTMVIRQMVGLFMDVVYSWDETHADEFTCSVHETCPDGVGEYSACFDAWKADRT